MSMLNFASKKLAKNLTGLSKSIKQAAALSTIPAPVRKPENLATKVKLKITRTEFIYLF